MDNNTNTKAEYAIFLLFKKHVEILRNMRPDLYWSFGDNGMGYSIHGNKAKDEINKFEENMTIVVALNTSIILNTTSFFEGFLENILLRRIGRIKNLPYHISKIIEEYQQQIIKISSFSDFKKYFHKLFEQKLTDILPNKKEDIEFIEKFYTVRHLLSHGSMLETVSKQMEIGRKYVHTDKNYQDLMNLIKRRYNYNYDLDIELYSLLNFSQIIDDFSNTVFEIANLLGEELKNKQLIESSNFWGDFSSRGMWGEI